MHSCQHHPSQAQPVYTLASCLWTTREVSSFWQPSYWLIKFNTIRTGILPGNQSGNWIRRKDIPFPVPKELSGKLEPTNLTSSSRNSDYSKHRPPNFKQQIPSLHVQRTRATQDICTCFQDPLRHICVVGLEPTKQLHHPVLFPRKLLVSLPMTMYIPHPHRSIPTSLQVSGGVTIHPVGLPQGHNRQH